MPSLLEDDALCNAFHKVIVVYLVGELRLSSGSPLDKVLL